MRKVSIQLSSVDGAVDLVAIDYVGSLQELKIVVSDLWIRFNNVDQRLTTECTEGERPDDNNGGV